MRKKSRSPNSAQHSELSTRLSFLSSLFCLETKKKRHEQKLFSAMAYVLSDSLCLMDLSLKRRSGGHERKRRNSLSLSLRSKRRLEQRCNRLVSSLHSPRSPSLLSSPSRCTHASLSLSSLPSLVKKTNHPALSQQHKGREADAGRRQHQDPQAQHRRRARPGRVRRRGRRHLRGEENADRRG